MIVYRPMAPPKASWPISVVKPPKPKEQEIKKIEDLETAPIEVGKC